MFPREAHFICRKCRTRFFFKDGELDYVSRTNGFGCPHCGAVTEGELRHVERFFKFYPRLIEATGAMAGNGFRWDGYTYKEVPLAGYYYFMSLAWCCVECGKSFSIPFVGRVDKLADEPRVFSCPKCRITPKAVRVTKEFFVCLKNVHKAAHSILDFQWDIFAPLQQEPDLYKIQSPIHRQAFP